MKNAASRGFTLIELLIVIAILGVLAVVVLVAINPVEQLAKTRDAGRISTVTQLGHALEAYYTARNAAFPTATGWGTQIVASGEVSTFPAGVAYSAYGVTACADTNGTEEPSGGIPIYCYDNSATNGVIVYARMESNTQNSKCGAQNAFAIFSSADGRGGIVCSAGNDLNPLAAGSFTYVN